MRKRINGQFVPNVEVVHVDGPRFLTFEADHRIWSGEPFLVSNREGLEFVRLRPPAGTSEAEVDEIRSVFEKLGIDVQVLARVRPQVVLEQATTLYEDKGIRETVEDMTEQANTKDRAALHVLVQRTLTEVGL